MLGGVGGGRKGDSSICGDGFGILLVAVDGGMHFA